MNLFSRLPLLALFLIGLTAVAAFAQQQEGNKSVDPQAVAELKKIYKEFDESSIRRDIEPTEKYLDLNYELQRGESKIKRAEVIKAVKSFFASVEEITEASSTIEKVELADGNYVLEVSSIIRGKIKSSDGKIVPFESIGKSTDFWTKTAGGWKENRQIVRHMVQRVDGKEIR